MLKLLKEHNYRNFFLSFTFGNFSEGIVLVSLPFVILSMFGSASNVGICLAFQMTGVLVAIVPGASLADKYSRVKLIAIAYILACIALTAGYLSIIFNLGIFPVAVSMFCFGISTAIYGPASDAMTPLLVEKDQLHRANSMDNLSQRIGQGILGPLVGGAVISLLLGAVSLLIAAVSCALSALFIWRIKETLISESESSNEESSQGWKEVIKYLKRSHLLLFLLLWVSVVVMLQVGTKPVAATAWVNQIANNGSAIYGLAISVGATVSSIVLLLIGSARLPRRYIEIMVASWALGATTILLPVFFPNPVLFIVSYGLGSGILVIGNVYWSTFIQSTVPDKFMTRIISIDWVASLALTPLGASLGGYLVTLFGAKYILASIGIIPLLSGASILLFMLISRKLNGGNVNAQKIPVDTTSN